MILAGDRIREARKKLGLSQEELGKKIGGVSKVTISGYENGTKNPKIDKFVKLVDVLDLTPDQLLNRDINIICEETTPYAFKISKKELKLIQALRQNKKVFDDIYKKLDIK